MGSTEENIQTHEVILEDQSSRLPLRRLLVVYLAIGKYGPRLTDARIGLDRFFHGPELCDDGDPGYCIRARWFRVNVMDWSFVLCVQVSPCHVLAESSCSLQLVYGRLSDIFGRKTMLQSAMALLALGNLLCSFAQTPIQLYIFRAISGAGGGGINNIAMIIVSL